MINEFMPETINTDLKIAYFVLVFLTDALLWELDTLHSNAGLLMADSVDKAYEFSDYLNPEVQPIRTRYLGTWLYSRIATRLTK